MGEYPSSDRQGGMFAIRYIRWLSDSGAAAEIGPDAFAVLVAVVSLEDELFYQRAPGFFNEQLARRCGIVSEHALTRARQRAIEAGLLVYLPGAKRKQGTYFVSGFTAESAANPECIPDSPHILPAFTAESAANPGPSKPKPKPIPIERDKRTRFLEPTLEEIRAYWQEASLRGSPEAFHDHYSSNGWRVGRNSMKDWRATARNWSRRACEFSKTPSPSDDEYDDLTARRQKAPA